MDRDDAYQAMMLAKEATKSDYDNRVTARSLLNMGPYRPGKRLKDIRVPLLIIGGTRDSVAPFDENTIRKANNPCIQIRTRSEEHTSELQSRPHLVCRLLLEKKKKKRKQT